MTLFTNAEPEAARHRVPEPHRGPFTKPLVASLARHLEDQAASLAEGALLVSGFQHAGHFTPGVRGGGVNPDDPLQGQWRTALISPHFVRALAALPGCAASRRGGLIAVRGHARQAIRPPC